jgi:hypothetical protein
MVEHRNAQVAEGFYARLCACLTRSLPGAASSASPSRNSSRIACTQEPHPDTGAPNVVAAPPIVGSPTRTSVGSGLFNH